MWKLITTIMIVLLALPGQSEAQRSAPTEEETIRSKTDAWMEAWNRGDTSAISQLVTEDYEVVMPDGTHIKGRAAYEKALARSVARRQGTASRSVKIVFVKLLTADVAVASGTWARSGGVSGPGNGSWVVTYIKKSGQWLMASGLWATADPLPIR
jgi:uncharacterized protein (TIGR02246 family)